MYYVEFKPLKLKPFNADASMTYRSETIRKKIGYFYIMIIFIINGYHRVRCRLIRVKKGIKI